MCVWGGGGGGGGGEVFLGGGGGGGGGGYMSIFSAGGRDSPPIPLVGKPLLN